MPQQWGSPCGNDCTHKFSALTQIPWRVFCKKACTSDGETWEECLAGCNEICYKDPVLKDQQWSAYIDRSPGSANYSAECFNACVSGCAFKFEMLSVNIDQIRPNRPPPPPPAPKPVVKVKPSKPVDEVLQNFSGDSCQCSKEHETMPQVKIIAKNFMDMVASLTARDLDNLYQSPFICEAILRSLPPLAKKYVLQMLYIEGSVLAKSMEEWVLADGFTKHRVAIDRLVQLRIFSEEKKKETSYRLNPTFQTNLQKHLIYGGALPREPMPSNVTVRLPTLEELEAYALGQWECFLLQLISSAQAEKPTNFSSSMMKVFQRGLLTQRDKESPRLSESGFQFLLMDTSAQLWYIIREYISNSQERGVNQADLISFLLELSFHVAGEAYNVNTLSELQKNMIKDFADLGLVKLQQGRKDSWFIPTKLATSLSISLTDSSSRKEGFVVVETNFRIYAYSTSKLHCEILRLFSRIEYQLPNLIVGAITKESLYNAFDNGITADQIIAFLQQNAHPRVAERIPSVPENVCDQIRLWESDLNRVEATPAYFYDEFPSRDVFEAACDYARDRSGLLWEDSKKMRLAVKAETHTHMREFLRGQS